jgi:hypothetical protein
VSWLGMASTDGNGDDAGGVECSSCASARWGRGLGLCKVEVDYRGSRAVADRRKREREEGSAGLVLGSSPCLQSNQIRQVVNLWQDLMLGFV